MATFSTVKSSDDLSYYEVDHNMSQLAASMGELDFVDVVVVEVLETLQVVSAGMAVFVVTSSVVELEPVELVADKEPDVEVELVSAELVVRYRRTDGAFVGSLAREANDQWV